MLTKTGNIKGPPPGLGDSLLGTPDPFGSFRGLLVEFNLAARDGSLSADVTEAVLTRVDEVLRGLSATTLHQTIEMDNGPFSPN